MRKVKRKTFSKTEVPVHDSVESYESLSDDERDQVDRYYSRPIPTSETRALTRTEREQFKRAIGKKPTRSAAPKTPQVVAVQLEGPFLKDVDAYARKHGMNRTEMIVEGLNRVMKQQ